jgi:hypothetical protein
MWFTKDQFALCRELRELGLEPRFDVGDVVARGFADLGFEEFQVLPGPRILSLTAGTVKPLPDEHRQYFFWIPSVEELVDLIEARGGVIRECVREDQREWRIALQSSSVSQSFTCARSIHEGFMRVLVEVLSQKAA